MGTRTVKVAVSLPQAEFHALEQLRKQLGASRSALITQAICYWLEAQREEEEIRRYIEGYQRYPETTEETSEAARLAQEVLQSEEWEG